MKSFNWLLVLSVLSCIGCSSPVHEDGRGCAFVSDSIQYRVEFMSAGCVRILSFPEGDTLVTKRLVGDSEKPAFKDYKWEDTGQKLLLQLLFIGIFRLQLLLLLFLRLCFFLALFCPRRHRNDHYHHPKQNQYNEIRFIPLFDPLSQDTVQKYSLPSPDILCFPSARQSHAAAALPLLFSFLPHRPKAAVPAR